jgi:hypothetical protein
VDKKIAAEKIRAHLGSGSQTSSDASGRPAFRENRDAD